MLPFLPFVTFSSFCYLCYFCPFVASATFCSMSDFLLSLWFFFSALMQGATGFGSAIGMNTFLTKIVDIKVVSPIVMALTLLLNITMLSKGHRLSHFPQLKQLIGWSLLWMPVGYRLLTTISHQIAIYIILTLITGLFCFEIFAEKTHFKINGRLLDVVCIAAGVFGIAYNVTGLFIALYVLSLDMEKERVIRLTATYFLIINIIGVSLFLWKGLYTPQVREYILTATPWIIFGGFGGLWINQYIPQQYFSRTIRGFLLLSIMLMIL